MKESRLTLNIKNAIRARGHPAWKVHGGPNQRAGIPDIIACVDGTFVGLEVKRPGRERTLTKLQHNTLTEIRKAEGLAAVVTSVPQALELVERVEEYDGDSR